jgi:hypothetical protein
MKTLVVISLVSAVVTTAAAELTTPTYRVRSVYNKQYRGEGRKLQDPFLTFSDDGSEREDEFFLDLFETPVQLTNSESPSAIQTALNFFLLSELSGPFFDSLDSVQSVTSEILSLAPREEEVADAATNRIFSRIGTEVRIRVYLVFDIKPSPEDAEAKSMMQQVMSNLTYFVTNLTSSLPQSSGKHELSGVYEAVRREIPSDGLSTTPNNTAIEGNEQNPSEEQIDTEITPTNSSNVAWSAVPVILVVAFLVLLLVFFVFRRRKRSSEPETPKNSAIVYMDVENELYSMDESVETSKSPGNLLTPNGGDSAQSSSIQYSLSGTEDGESQTRGPGDSIFSGIETEYRNVRSSKSTVTGFTRASASTIQVSNHERQKKTMSTTPKSYGANSSLFAFSEEGCDVDEDGDDRTANRLGEVPSLTKSDSSETSEEIRYTEREQDMSKSQHSSFTGTDTSTSLDGTKVSLSVSRPLQEVEQQSLQVLGATARDQAGVQRRQSWCGGNTSDVLADLETMATSRRDPTSDMARTIGNDGVPAREPIHTSTVSYNIFNCNPLIEDSSKDPVLPSPKALLSAPLDSVDASQTKALATKTISEGVVGTVPTTLLRNGGQNLATNNNEDKGTEKPNSGISVSAKSLVSGFFRGGRKSVSNPSTPSKTTSLRKPDGAASAPSSPNQQVGGHWMTSSHPSHAWRSNNSPSLVGDDDYDMNLSRPSTPGDDVAESLDSTTEDSYGYLPIYGYGARAETHQPPPAHMSKGRRHVGDQIGGDGSAMYQTSAMHPLDWSLKSSDMNSVGNSTISENEQVGTRIRGQYIFNKGRASIQTNGSLSPDVMETSKTPKSETTKESTTSRASASRQLINDLVWLEKKIAGVRQAPDSALGETTDSLSYVSNDNNGFRSIASQDDSDDEEAPTVSTGQNNSVMSSIVCRDCYAPPGKLHIVIHSTKDGPAVHTVKEGSSLEGHIFPGDLIISVDNIDTRSYTAEQVMKMMSSKGNQERKITVLHFEEE